MNTDMSERTSKTSGMPSQSCQDMPGVLGSNIPGSILAAHDKTNEMREKNNHPIVDLFFSFDIVNSTFYKSTTTNWPIIIRSLLGKIHTTVESMTRSDGVLWRVIGDEVVFVLPIQSEDVLFTAVDSVFVVLQMITNSLNDGSFFDSIEDQSIDQNQINYLKQQNTISVKSTAWIAVENNKSYSPFDSVRYEYSWSADSRGFVEYIGADIDAGFRLKEHTMARRLCISFELAYLLLRNKDRLNIMDYTTLKGIWNNRLYPIIWYHNPEIAKRYQGERFKPDFEGKFENSFQYDEAVHSPLVSKYLQRKQSSIGKASLTSEHFLDDQMYIADVALNKLAVDQNLLGKIEYIRSAFANNVSYTKRDYSGSLELHCAVVCCDVQRRKVLITHRGFDHMTNQGKWEFGCAHANRSELLVKTICDYYKTKFGIEIELVTDSDRSEGQPVPIAVYELEKPKLNIVKGIIFVARVINPMDESRFRAEGSHDEIKWISEEEIDNYSKEMAIQDFSSTLKTVFKNFNRFFGGRG